MWHSVEMLWLWLTQFKDLDANVVSKNSASNLIVLYWRLELVLAGCVPNVAAMQTMTSVRC